MAADGVAVAGEAADRLTELDAGAGTGTDVLVRLADFALTDTCCRSAECPSAERGPAGCPQPLTATARTPSTAASTGRRSWFSPFNPL
jgi:hypothetical protein